MNEEIIADFIRGRLAEQNGLNADDIDPNENFFRAGWVDSLGMFRLVFEIEKEFKRNLDIIHLSREIQPTIAGLASYASRQPERDA